MNLDWMGVYTFLRVSSESFFKKKSGIKFTNKASPDFAKSAHLEILTLEHGPLGLLLNSSYTSPLLLAVLFLLIT